MISTPTQVKALSPAEIKTALFHHPQWTLHENKIRREIKFKDFSEAFGAMTRIAMEAERLDHHPEWSNVYNRLTIELITHDAGPALSEKDFILAGRIDALVNNS
jgi:4a-hydroxytetrahydrobiopterin dehydratase